MTRVRVALVVGATALIALLLSAGPASAHPLGNFTSNTYAGVRVARDRIAVDYVLDLAEIPTQQTMPSVDADSDGLVSTGERAAYGRDQCAVLAAGLAVRIDGERLAVASAGGRLTFPPGLAGLSTLRLECDLSAPVARLGDVDVHDGNLADRVGWHEVTAVGDGTTLRDSSVPAVSASARLTAYPSGVPALDVRDATFAVRAGGAQAGPVDAAASRGSSVPGGDRATRLFASLVSDHDLSFGFALVAVGVALVLGAFHALAPGHGKTVMAAYVVGRKGGRKQAVGIGVAVAVTHTVGVLALGLVVWTSQAFAAERIYMVLGVASGLLVAAVGAGLLVRVVRAARAGAPLVGHTHGTGAGQHTHDWLDELEHELARAPERELVTVGAPEHDHPDHHDHGHHGRHDHHDHGHDDHGHRHGDHHDLHVHEPVAPATPPMGWGGILAMGFAGGMVPSPSAVVVLLGALALGRAWFGVTLVLAYGVGLALTLLVAGLVLVGAQSWLEPRLRHGGGWQRLMVVLPVLTPVAVFGGGLLLAARAARVL